MWHTHTHTHTPVNISHSHTHTRAQPYSMHSACAIFNFLRPTAAITINITETRQKPLQAVPLARSTYLPLYLPLSPSFASTPCATPSLSRMSNAIRIDIDANEKCQLFSRVAKQFVHEYEYECEYEYTRRKKNKEIERKRERESGRTRQADVVNFELLPFVLPAFNICLQLVKWTRNCGKYFQRTIKNRQKKIEIKKRHKMQNTFKRNTIVKNMEKHVLVLLFAGC